MSDPKDTTSFFRKVVKFVANPGTDWAEIATPGEDTRENEFARGELKAMIERKRRNDFVRKREFDMLRKVRREGLSPEQLAALGGLSKLDDSESRHEHGARVERGVKAKIDAIEQQMVGDAAGRQPRTAPGALRRSPEFYNAPTEPVPMSPAAVRSVRGGLGEDIGGRVEDFVGDHGRAPLGAPKVVMGRGMSPLADIRFDDAPAASPSFQPFAPEPVEVVHDPELDEAVIAFANADFEPCEQALLDLTAAGAARAQHAETWLVLFDFYRAVGQQAKFETLALDYAGRFGWSAPQWFSMPRLVAEASAQERSRSTGSEGQIGWSAPAHLDAEVVAHLASLTLQLPLPWIFEWDALRSIDVEGCARLSELFRKWIGQEVEMQWRHGERLFGVLAEAAPTGVKDADPAYWQLQLDMLRMVNRPDQFDETAIDYCVTYEVSPPSWEPARCRVRVGGAGGATSLPRTSTVSEVSTSFLESTPADDGALLQVGSVELSGQLVGDIGPTLKRLDEELGAATIVDVSCARLIRVDFIAAGDLLNWVLARRAENRTVRFLDAHRMIALFFGAMGINEHATVKIQPV